MTSENHTHTSNSSAASSALRLVLVETHSPTQSTSPDFLQMAVQLAVEGDQVQLHLMENGVTWLQQDPATLLGLLHAAGDNLTLTADDLSLDLRGIPREIVDGIASLRDADAFIQDLARAPVKPIWHD